MTGASAGIGWAICEALATAGVKVVAVARRRERLEALQQSLVEQGVPISDFLPVVCDITKVCCPLPSTSQSVSSSPGCTDAELANVKTANVWPSVKGQLGIACAVVRPGVGFKPYIGCNSAAPNCMQAYGQVCTQAAQDSVVYKEKLCVAGAHVQCCRRHRAQCPHREFLSETLAVAVSSLLKAATRTLPDQ